MTPSDSVLLSSARSFVDVGLTRDDALKIYYYMRLAREIDNRSIALYRQGRLSGALYTGVGNEATAVASAYALEDGDAICPMHRDLGAQLVRGTSPQEVFANYMGKADTSSRGKDSSLHIGSVERRVFSLISHLGSMIPLTVGAALASQLTDRNYVAMTYVGDGATSIGDFHEGLNFAAVRRLPFVLIIENNQYAYSTPTSLQFACEKLSSRAKGYGIPGEQVDGTDAVAVYAAARRAVQRARAGEGASLIETVTMRMRGHSEHDKAEYVPPELLEAWAKKDPIHRMETLLTETGWWSGEERTAMENRIFQEIDEALVAAENSPMPAPEKALTDVYAD
ncbi:MAG: thiamine pyrophosphate-dependent dehydrogenase E1 component subunit alpha [candidate division Zixibacteria bacterium]|nr:thiamine pyrophosphate-dependent dehydrogenase E1 component subunit alpha [candidate division Zixibacteria bacterium]